MPEAAPQPQTERLLQASFTSSTLCLTSLVEFDGSDVRPDRWPKNMERASVNNQAGNMDYCCIAIFIRHPLHYDGNGW